MKPEGLKVNGILFRTFFVIKDMKLVSMNHQLKHTCTR